MSGMKRVAVMIHPIIAYYRGILRGILHFGRGAKPWLIKSTGMRGYTLSELVRWQPDGIIALIGSEAVLEDLQRFGAPVVNVSGALQRAPVPRVGIDNAATGEMAAKHLLERGFRHFGFLGFPRLDLSNQRQEGFVGALKQRGYDCAVYNEQHAWTDEPGAAQTAAVEALNQWLNSLPRPVGILAYNDYRASRLAEVCLEQGIDVPKQLAIIGVDDDELECETAWPTLSSVRLPGEKVGYTAASLLERLMDGETPPSEPALIPPIGVVARGSTDTLAYEDLQLVTAMRFIQRNLYRPMTLEDVAHATRMTPSALQDRFQTTLGHSPEDEAERLRVERAKELLVRSQLTTLEVAKRVGYESFDDFNRAFKRWGFTTPLGFREEFRR